MDPWVHGFYSRFHGSMASMGPWLFWAKWVENKNSPKLCHWLVGGMASGGHCFLGDMDLKKNAKTGNAGDNLKNVNSGSKQLNSFVQHCKYFFLQKNSFPLLQLVVQQGRHEPSR